MPKAVLASGGDHYCRDVPWEIKWPAFNCEVFLIRETVCVSDLGINAPAIVDINVFLSQRNYVAPWLRLGLMSEAMSCVS